MTPLLVFLKSQSRTVRLEAIEAIQEIMEQTPTLNPTRSISLLQEALQDSDPVVRERAVEVFGMINRLENPTPMILILGNTVCTDENADVRKMTAWALGELGAQLKNPESVIPVLLIISTRDEHWQVQQTAATALVELSKKVETPTLWAAMQAKSDQTLPILIELATNPEYSRAIIPVLQTKLSAMLAEVQFEDIVVIGQS